MIPDDCPDCYLYTVAEFCNEHPQGEYVLILPNHIVAVKDGDYYDSFDSGNETIDYYFEKVE